MAETIVKGGHTTSFEYAPDRSRFSRVDTSTAGTKTTLYIGNVEIITLPNGNQERKRSIGGVALETSLYVNGSSVSKVTNYIFRDHLGSVDVVTDSTGDIITQDISFDAWGKRRSAVNWLELTPAQLISFDTSITTRGFTGHEMLDEVGIIHMNGRIYDPNMARFLQADPFVQEPTNLQSLNRYSYGWNNPLNTTDPSGYYNLIDAVFDILKIAVAITLGAAGDWADAAAVIGTLSFFQSLAAGAGFGDAFLAGVSGAALTYFGGEWYSGGFDLGYTARIATLGGITTALQGGKFGHGFLSSGIGAATAALQFKGTQRAQAAKRVTSAAVIGGTVSELTGGKFANGASLAAFSAAIASALDSVITSGSQIGRETRRKNSSLELSIVDDGGHLTTDAAALAAFEYNDELYLNTSAKEEVTGLFFENESNGRIYFTEGGVVSTNFRARIQATIPSSLSGTSFTLAGDFHTHPYTRGVSQEAFSKGDNNRRGKTYPRYLRTPRGDARVLRRYTRGRIGGSVSGSSICPAPSCLSPHPRVPQ